MCVTVDLTVVHGAGTSFPALVCTANTSNIIMSFIHVFSELAHKFEVTRCRCLSPSTANNSSFVLISFYSTLANIQHEITKIKHRATGA